MALGKPMWVESLMTDAQVKYFSKIYSTYNTNVEKYTFEECEYKWRYGMGGGLTPIEIKVINSRLDYVLRKARGLLKAVI